jgi:hypothetical protein
MANVKMTKKEMFTEILALVKDNKEMTEFIEHEIELLDKKKANGSKKAQANKDANLKLANELFVALKELDKPVTISEFQKESDYDVAILSNQKISSLLRTLIADGLVVRTEEKKKAYFSVVDTDTDEEVEE